MNSIINKLKVTYYFLIRSIGFYPIFISTVFIALALITLTLEEKGISELLNDNIPYLTTTSTHTARTVLSTIVTGIISIAVLSFSLVMIVLNLAVSNLSPRVVPGLISSRSNQLILGFYIGTIIYSLIILINVKLNEDFLPALGIVVAIICTLVSFALFVYFIHSMLQSIQIDKITESLYNQTMKELEKKLKAQENKEEELPNTEDWKIIYSKDSGFLQSFEKEDLIKLAKENDVIIEITVPLGVYVAQDVPIVKINKSVKNEKEFSYEIYDNLVFRQEEIVELNYTFGFKHLSEVAVKALSPGINDPGTAIRVLNYLQELFSKLIQVKDKDLFFDDEETLRIISPLISFGDSIFDYLEPIKIYGREDIRIILKQMEIIDYLIKKCDKYFDKKIHLINYFESLIEDAGVEIKNSYNRKKINEKITAIEFYLGRNFNNLR